MTTEDESRIARDPLGPAVRTALRSALLAAREARHGGAIEGLESIDRNRVSRGPSQVTAPSADAAPQAALQRRLAQALAWALGPQAAGGKGLGTDAEGPVVALYWPVRGEPGFGDLPAQWARAGLRLALPVVDARGMPLRFVAWAPGAPMCTGLFDIPRPQSDDALRPSVIFIPCVGFDHRGYRLGYGGGFYDRTLAALHGDGRPVPRTVGVAWDEAWLERLEPLPTDLPLDLIVTPGGAHGPACDTAFGSD